MTGRYRDRVQITESAVTVDGVEWISLAPATIDGVESGFESTSFGAELTLTTTRRLIGIATGAFHEPSSSWRLRPRLDELDALGVRAFGYQYMEFALPSTTGPGGNGLAPWPLRPSVAFPIAWQGPGTPAVLVGPLDQFHNQIIAVPSDEQPRDDLAAGWHGDLDRLIERDHVTIGVVIADDVRHALENYGQAVRNAAGTQRAGRGQDPAVRGISYWTDNGAHYYYRSEPGLDYPTTLERALAALADDGMVIHAVQLDSWWYPHEAPRGLAAGASVVPPSGAIRWEPRDDALPGGFERIREAIGGLPLVLHSRHLSAKSTYFGVDHDNFPADIDPDSGHAHAGDASLVDAWMEQAATWGACTYEQDWLVETFLTVDELRRWSGAADAWQVEMDRSAARRGLTLQFCMATPADILNTCTLTQVSSVRTSMDFQYAVGRQANWGWFLHVNALARALELNTSKDVFIAARGDDGWEDPLAGVEALLAAMSCGPVGFGDRIGATDRDLVLRTCREDGIIVMPDAPIAAINRSFLGSPMGRHSPLVGETYTDHPAGRWHYVAALGEDDEARVPVTISLDELDGLFEFDGLAGWVPAQRPMLAHRFSTGEVRTVAHDLELEPGPEGFDLWTIAPTLLDGRLSVLGDVSRYVSAGDRRIGHIQEWADHVALLVYGVPGAEVTVTWWAGSIRTTDVVVGPHGWTRLELSPDD